MFLIRIKILALSALLVSLTACAEKKIEPEVYLIPEGYIGTFLIVYNVKSGLKPEYENGSRLFRLSESGVFHSQFSDNYGIGHPDMIRFFYVSKDGARKEITESYGAAVEDTEANRKDNNLYVMGGGFGEFGFTEETTSRGCKYGHQRFYVGTLANRLEGKGNFSLEDYYLEHGYPCDGQLFNLQGVIR